jgi:SAM-dependent methyltransferase
MMTMPRLPIPSRILSLFRHPLRGFRRKAPPVAEPGSAPMVAFRCNLCGIDCRVPAAAISRETPSCDHCGSTVRSRAIVHLLTSELFGRSIALPDMLERRDKVGIGLSDAECYAQPLARKLGYTNTYFHTEPHLDIASVPDDRAALYDFIIASDVFEHVAPPVSRAFRNAHRLLKPGGVLIFTVPFTLEPDTVEHFPLLHDYRVYETNEGWQLQNRTVDGQVQIHGNLVFHGGPGTTPEMRLFSRPALEREFAAAGFSRVRVADEGVPDYGIEWPEPWSVPMVARA